MTNGENTIAILKVVADSSTNTDGIDNSSLETVLRALNFNVISNAGIAANSIVVERVDGPGADDVYATVNAAVVAGTTSTSAVTTTMASASAENAKFVSEAYFAVKITASGLTDTTKYYAQVELPSLDAGNISYTSDDSGFSNTDTNDAHLA